MVDEQQSRFRGESRKANEHFPCLLHSRKHPPWIGSRCRRATIAEACRAQGLPPSMVAPEDWENPIVLCHMLGNSMASNVLLRVMVPLLRTARPDLSIQDPWYTGRVQRLLRRSARATPEHTTDPPSDVPGPNRADDVRPTTQNQDQPQQARHEEAAQANEAMMCEQDICRARRGGALFEEIFQVIGPGATPRQIAAAPLEIQFPAKALQLLTRSSLGSPRWPPPPGAATGGMVTLRSGVRTTSAPRTLGHFCDFQKPGRSS